MAINEKLVLAQRYQQGKAKAAIEAEEGVIGCLLYNRHSINKVADTLKPDHFFRDIHAHIYEAILHLYQHDRKITIANVEDELDRRGNLEAVIEREGEGYLEHITMDNFAANGSVEDHMYKVIRKARARQLRYAAQEIAAIAESEDEDSVDQAMQLISDIAMDAEVDTVSTFSDAMTEYMQRLDKKRKDLAAGIAYGLPTGYADLDRMLGGLQPGALYTLGALTGYGKSAFAENIALNIALKAKHVMFISLEMGKDEIIQRALSMEALQDQSLLRDGYVDDNLFATLEIHAKRLAKQCDIKLDDGSYSMDAIRRNVQRVHARKKLDLIVVDYLQLVETIDKSKNPNRAQEIAELSKSLKRMAKKLNVPVLVLVQLNREVEKRQSQEPKLSDINESGGVARDSDVVMFLYATEEELQKRDVSQTFTVQIKVAKNRNGRMGETILDFCPQVTKFSNINFSKQQEVE